VQLEGLGQLKNPMTSSGIKPATFLQDELRNSLWQDRTGQYINHPDSRLGLDNQRSKKKKNLVQIEMKAYRYDSFSSGHIQILCLIKPDLSHNTAK
jgi:hypothetical protein